MKKTKSKKAIEDYWQKEYWNAIKRYRGKLMFWQPLGIAFLIILSVFVLYLLVHNLNDYPNYTITKTECQDISTARDCECLERVRWNGVEFNCKLINESSCIEYYIPVCNKTEVNELMYADESCIAHYGNTEEAIFNCITFVKNDKYLNDVWLNSHCECNNENWNYNDCMAHSGVMTYSKKSCDRFCGSWKCGEFEVKRNDN